MKKFLLLPLMAVALVLVPSPASAKTEHCPDKDNPAKVEANGGTQVAINNLVLDAGTLVCIKGSNEAVTVVANGTLTLKQLLGNGHDVSYYIVIAPPPNVDEPVLVTVEVCLNAEVVTFGPHLKVVVDAVVALFLSENPGASIKDGACPVTTTTVPTTTPTTTVTVPQVVEAPHVVCPASDGFTMKTDPGPCPGDAPAPAAPVTAPGGQLPRTGSNLLLPLLGLGLTSSGLVLRRFMR